ncbi:MAG: ABC transporter substrate-binding protein [Chloroflexota bacterium]|nr:ABC transporter substrate-binding protein [Chloroflexota bacterium]
MQDERIRGLIHSWMSGRLSRRELTRRLALLGLSAPAAAASWAAPGAAANGMARQGDSVELLYMTHQHDPAVAVNEQLIAEFQQQHPNIKITYDHAPHENYEQKILTAFGGGQGPDVFWAGDWMVPQFVEGGIVAEVDPAAYGVATPDEFIGLYEEGALDAFVVDNKVLTGGISEYNTFSLVYHPSHFEEAGLPLPPETEPMTWEDLAGHAEKLTKIDGDERVRSGIEWNYNVPIWTVLCFEPMVRQLGGQLVDPASGEPNFTSPEMVKVMQYVQDLRIKHRASDPAFVVDLVEDFANERVSMITAGPWALPAVTSINPNAKVAVAPLPVFSGGQPSTTLYAWAWFVNQGAAAEKRRAAFDFVAFLTSKAQLWWDEVGYIQPRRDLTVNGQSLADYYLSTTPMLKVFQEDFSHGVYQFRSTKYFEISAAWTRALQQIMEGEDVQKVLEDTNV